MLDAVRRLISSARRWVDGLAVVDAASLDDLATLAGVEPQRFDEPCTLLVDPPAAAHLPPPERIDRVVFRGWLAQHQATLWCRRDSPVLTSSPAPWPDRSWPWVVEIHMRTTELDGSGDGLTAFGVPCLVDPRVASPRADAAIALVVARAMLHEGQESIVGLPRTDPHVMGEVGLCEVAARLGAACWEEWASRPRVGGMCDG